MSSIRTANRWHWSARPKSVVMTTRYPYAAALEMGLLDVIPYGTPANPSSKLQAPPGSGPFVVKSFARDEAVTLVRNRFHSSASAAPAGLIFKIVPDATVRALDDVDIGFPAGSWTAAIGPLGSRESNLLPCAPGPQWVRQKAPASPSTPPFSCASPGLQNSASNP